ncbi:MAG: phosphatase [Ignavibacteriaceae bacterium]|jgi:phosphoglycolate phosphatase|nr:HAD family hydrolase [Ignavibacteria bacterium]NUM62138.1 HAD family hydrolase [Ignavibacteriaceae bacterium]GJQ43633.1 MAG: phosphatase [Ignavibacteriaceae bacterium]
MQVDQLYKMNQSKKYNHIIWDWNGTLLNDVELCAGIMNMLLAQESLPQISVERYKEIFTFPIIEYYKIAGHSFERNSFEVLGKQFIDEYEIKKDVCDLYPGVRDLLSELQNRNINQHLLSAYEQNSLNRIVKQFALGKYFQNVVGLDNVYANGKAHIAKQLEAKINSNGQSGKILLIGDTIHDYEVSREINSDCILISHGHQDEERLLKLGIPVVKNFEELIIILKDK